MVNDTLRSNLLTLAVVLTALWSGAAHAAQITVQTDRGTIRMNEAFTLTFSAQGSVDGNPDFSPLQQDFEIAGTSQNSSFTIINGQAESRSNWLVTVFPKRPGTLTVPPVRFGADESPELQIEVQAGADPGATDNREIFITVEAEPKNPYVQAQSIVTVRLYRAANMANENLSALDFSSSDVIVHALDEGNNFKTNLYGRQYDVHERRYAVFPQQPGTLRIKPLQYSGLRLASRRGFFTDPFGSVASQPVRVASEPATLEVRPAAAAPWLPASRLKIEEKWSGEPAEFKLGEPLTRRLRITATGLTAEQLPALPAVAADGFRQYPDQPVLENSKSETGITGVHEESVAFMPTRPGSYTLPAVEIRWWNTKSGKAETARVPERTVTVIASGDGGDASIPTTQQAFPAERVQPTAPETGLSRMTETSVQNQPLWFWLSLALALGWLSTLAIWWRQSRSSMRMAAPVPAREKPDIAKAEKMLEQACRGNRADAAKDALLEWARARWQPHPPQSLEGIAARSGDPELTASLRALSARLYAPGASAADWDGRDLWQAFTAHKGSTDEKKTGRKTPSLPPLHKI
jgi:hypothetical protein